MDSHFFEVQACGPRLTIVGHEGIKENEKIDTPYREKSSEGLLHSGPTGTDLCSSSFDGPIQQIACYCGVSRNEPLDTKNIFPSMPDFLGAFKDEEGCVYDNSSCWVMVRTLTTCNLVELSFQHTGNNPSCLTPSLDEVCTINLRETKAAPSWGTFFKHGSAAGVPLFSISASTKERSSIFRIELESNGNIFEFYESSFNSIAHLKQLEFTLHPMRVWAVATRRYEFGEAVFLCDLRQPSSVSSHGCATRFWSPSHAAHMMDGLCTIRSMWQHPQLDETLFVATNSNKVYELDTRMANREVTSWEMPEQLRSCDNKERTPSIMLRCDVLRYVNEGIVSTKSSEIASFSNPLCKFYSHACEESSFDITPMGYCEMRRQMP